MLEEVIESRQLYGSDGSIWCHATMTAIGVAVGSDSSVELFGNCEVSVGLDLLLRQGGLSEAKTIFEESLPVFNNALSHDGGALECMEALADISMQLSDLLGAGRWTAVCIAVDVITSDKLPNMNALRRSAAIYDMEGDQDTALSFLRIALEGFKLIEDFQLAIQLLEAARPEFESNTGGEGCQDRRDAQLEEKGTVLTEFKLRFLPSIGPIELVVSRELIYEGTWFTIK
ncbi:hypothetical protein B0H16DRAFT_1461922 [Mycena metata]|uniref:Uncharacterized protein n=1 Tax=Mycena metata TaxID=1033252 RepID=A0AAD7IQ53_9AGAR|nr:hypothetical protein B0H16DRAFT_1461922 [Mycena metata]